MKSFKLLNTRDGANKGALFVIEDEKGVDTGDWLQILGIDSDQFQRASRIMRRNLMSYLERTGIDVAKNSNEYYEYTGEQARILTSSLVSAWSFEEPCTPENVLELLTIAPYLVDRIDSFASKRERFASSSPNPSLNTPSGKSTLVSLPKAAKTVSH